MSSATLLLIYFVVTAEFVSVLGEKYQKLHEAVRRGYVEEVNKLIPKRYKIDSANSLGTTALHIALGMKNIPMVNFLLRNGANVNAGMHESSICVGERKIRPLHMAVQNELATCVFHLLKRNADVNALDCKGNTAIFYAAAAGSLEIARILITTEGIELNKSNEIHRHNTPLGIAVDRGDEKMVTTLLEGGGDVTQNLDDQWNTLLHRAIEKRNVSLAKLLVKNGAPLEAKNKSDLRPLARAALLGDARMVEMLLDAGASVTGVNTKHKWLPLHYAAVGDSFEVIMVILKHGAILNASDELFYTALHQAAFIGNQKMVEFLLAKGASAALKTKSGKTPMESALDQMRRECVCTFIDAGGVAIPHPDRLLRLFWKKTTKLLTEQVPFKNFDDFISTATKVEVEPKTNFKELARAYVDKGAFALYKILKDMYVKKPEETPHSNLERNILIFVDMIYVKMTEKTYMGLIPVEVISDVFILVGFYSRKVESLAWSLMLAAHDLDLYMGNSKEIDRIVGELYAQEFL